MLLLTSSSNKISTRSLSSAVRDSVEILLFEHKRFTILRRLFSLSASSAFDNFSLSASYLTKYHSVSIDIANKRNLFHLSFIDLRAAARIF